MLPRLRFIAGFVASIWARVLAGMAMTWMRASFPSSHAPDHVLHGEPKTPRLAFLLALMLADVFVIVGRSLLDILRLGGFLPPLLSTRKLLLPVIARSLLLQGTR